MKIRADFVTNSSSSSFIMIFKENEMTEESINLLATILKELREDSSDNSVSAILTGTDYGTVRNDVIKWFYSDYSESMDIPEEVITIIRKVCYEHYRILELDLDYSSSSVKDKIIQLIKENQNETILFFSEDKQKVFVENDKLVY